MFLFNSENVYSGYSSSELSVVLDALSSVKIHYKWKIIRMGGINRFVPGTDINYSVMYTVKVMKSDAEMAGYLVNKALHQGLQ